MTLFELVTVIDPGPLMTLTVLPPSVGSPKFRAPPEPLLVRLLVRTRLLSTEYVPLPDLVICGVVAVVLLMNWSGPPLIWIGFGAGVPLAVRFSWLSWKLPKEGSRLLLAVY